MENSKLLIKEKLDQLTYFELWLKSKRYSQSTIKTYLEALKNFFTFYNAKPTEEIDNNDLILYHNNYILRKGLSTSYQNQIINALKLYYQTIEGKKMDIEKIDRQSGLGNSPMC